MSAPIQNINNAIQAYSNALGGRTEETSSANFSGGSDFADLVKGAIQEARKISERSEQLSIAAINDKADMTQVITAVAEAEVTLQTVVNVRDKVLESYNSIIRMPM